MKTHITKAVAFLMTLMMIVTAIPTTVLAQAVSAFSDATGTLMGEATLSGFDALASGVVQGKALAGTVDASTSPYEPTETNDPNDPFLPGNAAWIDLSKLYYGSPATPEFPMLKWSANTSVVNTTGKEGVDGSEAFSDVNLIDSGMWSGGNYQADVTKTKANADATGIVYNRYDPMQGKWGLTFDRNAEVVTWGGTSFNLSDTPYLYFSTEMDDSVEMAISLRIADPDGVTRWYTITDNNNRPGISTDTRGYSMIPDVTVTSVDLQQGTMTNDEYKTAVINALNAKLEEALAVESGKKGDGSDAISVDDDDYLYVSGTITGCIDFTYLIDMIYTQSSTGANIGRAGMGCTVESIRVDLKGDAPARINYLYFGPNYGSVLTPQVTTGEANTYDASINVTQTARDIANGWENGQAVTITNTPKNPQVITIDTENADNLFTVTTTINNVETELVTVTIPVRKWFNSLSDARKFVMSLDIDESGVVNDAQKPTVSLWGNPLGSVGADALKDGNKVYADGRTNGGVRCGREGMLAVLGNGIYLSEPGHIFRSASIDRTLSNSTSYDGTESWYDLLRSPYMYDETVTAANDACGIDAEMVGYVYITAVRVCVVKGTKLTIQGMRCEGCSAGLNMRDDSGQNIVAYDGGSGVQPVVDITSTGTFTTYSPLPAAYGPYLRYSDYTSKNLLTDSDGTLDVTSKKYGQTYKVVTLDAENGPQDINKYPADAIDDVVNGIKDTVNTSPDGLEDLYSDLAADNETIASKYGVGQTFTVYATFKNRRSFIKKSDNKPVTKYWVKYGLVGVLDENGKYQFGWTALEREISSGTKVIAEPIDSGVVKNYNLQDDGTESLDGNHNWFITNESDWKSWIYQLTQNNWMVSNFGQNQDFNSATAAQKAKAGQYPSATDLVDTYTQNNTTKYYTKLAYGNMYSLPYSAQNVSFGANANSVGSWQIQNTGAGSSSWSAAYTRTYSTPFTITRGDANQSYPVLYYDIEKESTTAGGTFIVGLVLSVNDELKLYYLDMNNKSGNWSTATNYSDGTRSVYGGNLVESTISTRGDAVDSARADMPNGNYYGYVSFENMVRKYTSTDGELPIIKLVSMSVLSWDPETVASNLIFRRFELLVEQETYLDDINTNSPMTDAELAAATQNNWANVEETESVLMYDGFNILNDAYYYNHTYDGNGNALDDNDAIEAVDTGSKYGKKGWTAILRHPYSSTQYGTNYPNTYAAYTLENGNEANVYEYRTSLGHMRVWLDGIDSINGTATTASLVLETNSVYNINNYKYLYYSYSMRDAETGIAVEDDNANKQNGIEIVVKEQSGSGVTAYVDEGPAWEWKGNYSSDSHTYETSANAVVDLKSLAKSGDAQITQIVIYFKNSQPQDAEFYLNYLYLSNAEPTDQVKDIHNTQEYQYYYMMDNTGDRYSARFPTVNNPDGAVTDPTATGAESRVNPIKIKRGEVLYNGTFYNGASLKTVAQPNNGPTLTGNDAYDAIWFYKDLDNAYWTGDSDEIWEYYTYRDGDDEGTEGTITDMRWSFGRWYGVNTASINTLQKDASGNTTGTLLRRYATDDEVLLRAGIEPLTFMTYYDAQGGKMVYKETSDDLKNDIIVNDNSYYVTKTAIYSYFQRPTSGGQVVNPTKYGYTFDGWYYQTTDNTDGNGTLISGSVEDGTAVYEKELAIFLRKVEVGADYFYAKWTPIDSMKELTHTATFLNVGYDAAVESYADLATDENTWFTRIASFVDNSVKEQTWDSAFSITIPNMLTFRGQDLDGWYALDEDGKPITTKLYAPGTEIIIQKDRTFIPVVNATGTGRVEITVTNAELYLVFDGKDVPIDDNVLDQTGLSMGTSTDGLTTTYYNVPKGLVMVAKPKASVQTESAHYWTIPFDSSTELAKNTGAYPLTGSTEAVVGLGATYIFSAYATMKLNYTNGITSYTDNIVVSTSPHVLGTDNELTFYAQYDDSLAADNVKVLAAGTLYTHSTKSFADVKATISEKMKFDTTTTPLTAANIEQGSYQSYLPNAILHVKASNPSERTNQYYLTINADETKTRTYFTRSYVIYSVTEGETVTYKVAYSDVVAGKSVTAVTQ